MIRSTQGSRVRSAQFIRSCLGPCGCRVPAGPSIRSAAGALLLLLVAAGPGGLKACLPQPECVDGTSTQSECRVVAENEYARLILASGVELRFQEPGAESPESWAPLGLLEEVQSVGLRARPAGLGDFALSIDARGTGVASLDLLLDNVDPQVAVHREAGGRSFPVSAQALGSLRRHITVPLDPDGVTWLRGTRRDCPTVYRLAAVADIQTNPLQMRRIIDRITTEERDPDTPLLGLLLLGDLSENADEDELRWVDELLRDSPVPVAVTPGNHDVFSSEMGLFNRVFGPGNFAFSVCGSRVTMLDTGNGDLADSVRARLPELLRRGASREGVEDRFLITGMHYPMHYAHTGGGWTADGHRFELQAAAVEASMDLTLAGHVHYWHHFEDVPVGDGAFTQVITGTAGAHQGAGGPTRFGYTRILVDPDAEALDYCFVPVPPPGGAVPAENDRVPYCD